MRFCLVFKQSDLYCKDLYFTAARFYYKHTTLVGRYIAMSKRFEVTPGLRSRQHLFTAVIRSVHE